MQTMKAETHMVAGLVREIAPLLHDYPPEVQGAVLCSLLGTWLAGHHASDERQTSAMRCWRCTCKRLCNSSQQRRAIEMPCDSRLKRGQTIKQRVEEVRAAVERFSKGLVRGTIKATVGPTGGIAFTGLSETERDGVTDACVYRRLLATGSPLALQAIQRAELLAGRSVDKMAVAHGHHAHADAHGHLQWHNHKG